MYSSRLNFKVLQACVRRITRKTKSAHWICNTRFVQDMAGIHTHDDNEIPDLEDDDDDHDERVRGHMRANKQRSRGKSTKTMAGELPTRLTRIGVKDCELSWAQLQKWVSKLVSRDIEWWRSEKGRLWQRYAWAVPIAVCRAPCGNLWTSVTSPSTWWVILQLPTVTFRNVTSRMLYNWIWSFWSSKQMVTSNLSRFVWICDFLIIYQYYIHTYVSFDWSKQLLKERNKSQMYLNQPWTVLIAGLWSR